MDKLLKAELRNLEEALAELSHVSKKFDDEGFQRAFEKIIHFLTDLRDFLSNEEYISPKIGLKRKKDNEPVVLKFKTLTDHQQKVLWLSDDEKRNFTFIKRANELLTPTAPNSKNFLPSRASQIITNFINIYDYILSSGTFSVKCHIQNMILYDILID